jgi:hypothetical protein
MAPSPPAWGHTKTHGQDDQMAINPMADYYRGVPPWELSELTVLEEKSASAGNPLNDRRA